MLTKRWWRCVMAVASLGICGAASAAPDGGVSLIAADAGVFCTLDERNPTAPGNGMVCDLLRELSRRVGHPQSPKPYPLQRAMMVAATGPGIVMAPLTRTPLRERNYQWLVRLFDEDFVVVAKRGSNVDISTLDKVGRLRVGVVREGVSAEHIKNHGWQGLQLATRDVANARKLDRGRIDAWVGPWNGILSTQRAAGLRTEDLRRGVLLKRTGVYLVGSPDLDPAIGGAWKKAFDDMIRDGSYGRVLHQYGFVSPPPSTVP
ncbi:substrate-binding periplasmic protein [Rugamonas rubra]|nr:ABC transporter substrate-binding protein [Rugamonas rubra]